MKCLQFCVLFLTMGYGIVSQPPEQSKSDKLANILQEINLDRNFAEKPQIECSEVEFHFYGCKNKIEPYIVKFFPGVGLPSHDAWKLYNLLTQKSGFKILVHSWRENVTSESMQLIKDSYLKSGCYNIFVYNWFKNSNTEQYITAANYTPTAGKHIADFINILNVEEMSSSSNIHLIGFGLGAHIVGYAGTYSKHKVQRITGLDPFSSGFDDPAIFRPLNIKDARLVDVIHTTAGSLGYYYTMGKIDFYPNEGEHRQPGCSQSDVYCSHERAYQYFAESITSDVGFYGYECGSWDRYIRGECRDNVITIGEGMSDVLDGVYYLQTNVKSPFAKGKDL